MNWSWLITGDKPFIKLHSYISMILIIQLCGFEITFLDKVLTIMWIIIERLKTKPEHCWFSGVFLRQNEMQSYLSILPERPTETREIREIPVHEYPVLFVYDSDIKDLSHVTLEQIIENRTPIVITPPSPIRNYSG